MLYLYYTDFLMYKKTNMAAFIPSKSTRFQIESIKRKSNFCQIIRGIIFLGYQL
uniref:Uncharacterized protein n=1 Tax=Lepeophtheirus salmonis TaxID=72036 RepID=A0A0K2V2W3_LEPSM